MKIRILCVAIRERFYPLLNHCYQFHLCHLNTRRTQNEKHFMTQNDYWNVKFSLYKRVIYRYKSTHCFLLASFLCSHIFNSVSRKRLILGWCSLNDWICERANLKNWFCWNNWVFCKFQIYIICPWEMRVFLKNTFNCTLYLHIASIWMLTQIAEKYNENWIHFFNFLFIYCVIDLMIDILSKRFL